MATTIPTGFANVDNTGVPSGTTLTAYTGPMTITTNGTLIENKIINGALDITGANVTIRNCIITYNDFFGIDVRGANITVENCTIIGPGYKGDSPAAISCDVGGGKFVGNDISGAEHGIVLGPGSSVVKGNYIHDAGSNKADPHIGGISLKGEQNNVLIEDNTVILGSDATSDIFLQNNWGPISNVTINHNYLAGDPGYNIYVEGRLSGGPVTGVSITNNVIVQGHYGDYSIVEASPNISGNVEFPPGTTVTTDPTGGTQPPTSGSVSINDISISEGDNGTKVETFTVTRSGGTAAFDVNFATSDGTATTADSDYVAASNTLHFGANQNTQTISVTINGDTKVEANETFNVGLSNATNGATISDSHGVGTITNDDVGVTAGSVSINDISISEGDNGTKVETFTVTRSGGTAAFDVNFATSGGTATTADSDYVAASNTLHFGANQNTQTISVTINGDTKVEANETFNVVLSNATNGATISDSQGIGTITNDDVTTPPPPPTTGTNMAQAINEEFNPWSGNVSPDGVWQLAGNWFGTGNNQFGLARETLTSTHAGETDTGFLNLTITPSTNPLQGGEIQTTSGYGYGLYEVRMETSAVSGGVASFFLMGAPNYQGPEFDIEFLLNSHNQVTFTDHPLGGTGATTYYNLGFDPTAAFHTYGINWIPGPIAGTATVQDLVDGQVVHSETSSGFLPPPDGNFIMMNAWSGNANFGGGPPAQNSTTVYDWVHFTPYGETPPPPPPSAGSVSVNNAATTEGDSGTHVETFTVTRSGGTAAFDVNFATSDGTATVADSDYVAASNTLHFGANQNTQTISVTINGDTKVEANETFNVVLSNATNGATLSDGQGVGTITNDDVGVTAGSVSINDVTISEGDSGTKVETFTVTRSGGTAAFDVNFATSNATATVADGDYVAASNTLHFGANQNTQTISVMINGDTKVEANETFNVVLSNATNGATISDSKGVGTITNDDGAPTANLVANGGFETGDFGGWTLGGNSSGIYIAPTAFPGEVHTGSYSAGLGSMNRTDGILTQNMATTAGQHYTLSFWIESDNDGFTPANHFAAEWNGQTLMALTDAPNSGYQLYTFDVVGINGNSVLEFDAYNNPDAWRLDDVTLTAAGGDVVGVTAGSVLINDVTISEGDSGTKVETFTVTRSGGTAAFDVNFATSNATATVADGDYVAASNTLHFGANQNTQTISVMINGDTKVEANETFNVVLSNATHGATISDSKGVGTITNDDVGGTAPADIEFTNLSLTKIQGIADAGSVIILHDGLTSLGSAAAGTDGSWTFTKALSDTVHIITAQEVDSSGQVVSTSSGEGILGSTRKDVLHGTTGSDLFVGNGGQDTFVFAANFGNDVIRDFGAFGRGHDVVEFSKTDFDSFASVLSHASQVGQDVVISAGSDTLTLKNTKLGALDSHDFHFA